jgi:myosin heavy subunit
VGKSFLDTLTHSTNPFVVDITNTKHGEDGTTTTAATKQATSSQRHKVSKSRLSFIGCLKPNQFKSECNFVEIFFLQQLRYLGIADRIRVIISQTCRYEQGPSNWDGFL